MTETATPRRRLSPATLALTAAALLASAAIGVALYRSAGGEEEATGPHGSVTPAQPVARVEDMVARLETRMRENPDDPQGWRMLGWSYFEIAAQAEQDTARAAAMRRSADAYRRAAELEPNNVENWSSLGEALQTATQQVSPEAEAAFRRALTIDADDPRSRYFLAVQKDLLGQHAAAVTDWIALLRDTPAGAPWEADLRRTIQQVASEHDIALAGRMPARQPAATTATAAIPGPTPEQMASASSIPPSQQDEMVKGMVDRLAARLAQNPRDADGWIRLMRSHMVLNDAPAATRALRSGLAAFQSDAAAQTRLRAAATDLGVPAG